MAYIKKKKKYGPRKLTTAQENFIYGVVQGKSKKQAYLDAYPSSRKWKDSAVSTAASQLFNLNYVQLRYKELNNVKKEKIAWTRDRALEEINFVLEMNRKDIERINETYEKEVAVLYQKIDELNNYLLECDNPSEINAITKEIYKITNTITKLNKQKRMTSVNNNGILNAAKILNRMQGYDVTKVEITTADLEKENMKELSKEELIAIAEAEINKGDPE